MKLPKLEQAFIPDAKITAYLLSDTHASGKYKAVFFKAFGFTIDSWQGLRDALLAHAKTYEVTRQVENEDGVKYIIEGALETPDGRNPAIRAIWIIDADAIDPRFVTAYPLDEE